MSHRPIVAGLVALSLLSGCGGDASSSSGADAAAGRDVDGGGPDGAGAGGEYEAPGPSAVTTSDATIPLPDDRDVTALICAPSAAADRPLVVISPGFALDREQYASFCDHLATWGYPTIVAGYTGFSPNHSVAADDRAAILDWATTAPALGAWDGTRVALAGHSLGGKVSILAAVRDARVGLVVAWDPVDAGNPSLAPEQVDELTAPLVVLGETLDGTAGEGFGAMACAPTDENYAQYFAAAPSPTVELTVTGADHMDWVDDGACLACSFCKDGTADREEVRAVTRRTNVAALRHYLEGDADAATWLTGAGVTADARVVVRSK